MIQSRVDFGFGVVSETTFVALIPGDPAAELFDTSDTLSEVPRSKLFYCSTCPVNTKRQRLLDSYYYSHHQPSK